MKIGKRLITVLLIVVMVFITVSCAAGKSENIDEVVADAAQTEAEAANEAAAAANAAAQAAADAAAKLAGQLAAAQAAAAAAQAAASAAQAAVNSGKDSGKWYDIDEFIKDNYGMLIENPFIKTSDNAISTFSADVDTASYTYFRKLVNAGYGIEDLIKSEGSNIRTEEMINYFSYDYSGPEAGELFGINAQISDCPWNDGAVLLCLGLKAGRAEKVSGNNLVFLIDVSGSMGSTDKLELLKKAFNYLTKQLTGDDTVSIVTYASGEKVVLEGCSGSKADTILKTVNSLRASGSTNGQAGIQKAYEIAKEYYIEGGNNRIIMASDGDLNVGISEPEELKRFIAGKRDEGIYLSVLGFGTGNYRDDNMEALADNGNGVYYYIDGAAEAEKVFGTDLLGTLYTVAEDLKLQITFDSLYVDSYRLVGYENRLLKAEDFNNDKKDAGDVGAGHSVTVCYELKLKNYAKTAGATWLKLAVRYKKPGETVSLLNEYNIGQSEYTNNPNTDFRFICAVVETSMLLHRSSYLGNINIDDISSLLKSLYLWDSYKTEFRDLVSKLAR